MLELARKVEVKKPIVEDLIDNNGEISDAVELKCLEYQEKERERDAHLKLMELREIDCHAKGTGSVSYNSRDPSYWEIYRL